MALKKGDMANFDMLKRACLAGDLGLVEMKDAKTGEYRAVLTAVVTGDDGITTMTPFGHLFLRNGYEEYIPPTGEAA